MTSIIMRGVGLALLAAAASGGFWTAAAQSPPVASPGTTTPTFSTPPEVSDWTPRGQAYPGQTLTVRGQGFRPADFIARLGTGTGAVTLTVISGTSTEMRLAVPSQLAPQGLPLSVRHVNGQSRELESSYRVLPRDVLLSGESLWHITDSTTTSIFSRGTVSVTLELFEFGTSGAGSYAETVSLVRKIRTFQEACTTNLGLPGQRDVDVWQFQTQRPNRRLSWRKLADGRVELRDVGVDPVTITATLGSTLQANFSTTAAGPYTEATNHRFDCRGLSIPSGDVPPLQGVPYRRVEWTLARNGGT